MKVNDENINIQIYINKKEVTYSRQNLIAVINAFLPYLTNPDLDELNDRCKSLKEHRLQQEQQSIIDCQNIPIQSNRHDT
jgi:glutamate synthase domain-containing protein 1